MITEEDVNNGDYSRDDLYRMVKRIAALEKQLDEANRLLNNVSKIQDELEQKDKSGDL